MYAIQRATIRGYKRIQVFELSPNGEPVILEGKNQAGKSSVLDGIAMVLFGKKFIPDKAVNENAEEAYAEIDFGDVIVSKKITKSGNDYLQVKTRDGMSPQKPQAWLDERLSALSRDPVEFVRYYHMDKKKAAFQLKKALGLDTEKIDESISSAEEDRKSKKKSLQTTAAELQSYEKLPALTTIRSVSEVQAERAQKEEHNQKLATAAQRIFDGETKINELDKSIADLEVQLKEKRKLLGDCKAGVKKLQDFVKGHEQHDLFVLDQEIEQITEQAKLASKYERKTELTKLEKKQSAAVVSADVEVKKFRAEKEKLLANAKMPVPGMVIEDNAITLNGIDLCEIAESEQIAFSLRILAAQNPEIRIALIQKGNDLDTESRKKFIELCKKLNIQPWIQLVQDEPTGQDNSVYIVDGCYQE